METIKRIINFFKPYKWETIWTGKADGYVTKGGVRLHETELVCVVQYDRYKNTYRAYMTNGNLEKDIDINYLTEYSEELRKVLKQYTKQ